MIETLEANLNTKALRGPALWNRYLKRGRRCVRRDVMRMRRALRECGDHGNKNCEICERERSMRRRGVIRTFEVSLVRDGIVVLKGERTTKPLDLFLEETRDGDVVQWKRVGGTIDSCDYFVLKERFGRSEVCVDGVKMAERKWKKMRCSMRVVREEESVSVKVVSNRGTEEDVIKELKRLDRQSWKKVVRGKTPLACAEMLWTARKVGVKSLDDGKKARVTAKLTKHLRDKCGVSSKLNLCVRYEHSEGKKREEVRRLVKEINKRVLRGSGRRACIINGVTTAMARKRSSVSDMLVNNGGRMVQEFGEQAPDCCGHEQCKGGKHFQGKLSDMPGLAGRVGKVNAKTVPRPVEDMDEAKFVEAIANYYESVLMIVGGGLAVEKQRTSKTSWNVWSGISFRG
jgi:hypothetical protein